MEVLLPDFVQRKNNRLEGYDYSQEGLYFVTICTKDREKLFWDDGTAVGAAIGRPSSDMEYLSDIGLIVQEAIRQIPVRYPMMNLHIYAIMPDHTHMILEIANQGDGRPMAAPTIGRVINQCKGYASKQAGKPLWQKLFNDRIIRNEREYQEIWQYIENNPLKWELDCH